MKVIPYGRQLIDEDDIAAVVAVLRSDWLTQGPAIERFERKVADYCGVKYAVAVANGTAALHIAAAALDARGIATIDGALLDLGVSSMQFDAPGRGFSFRRDEPLDMRMDQSAGPSAADLIRTTDEETIADAVYQFGEERHSRRVARAIVMERERAPIETTGRLAEIVRRAVPHRGYQRIDPATRTFQGLRIWVNQELDGLDQALRMFLGRLAPGGRLVVISFHSLEDRVVKHTLRAAAADDAAGVTVGIRVLTKRPAQASDDEVERNPRARSAKLRAAERVGSRQ